MCKSVAEYQQMFLVLGPDTQNYHVDLWHNMACGARFTIDLSSLQLLCDASDSATKNRWTDILRSIKFVPWGSRNWEFAWTASFSFPSITTPYPTTLPLLLLPSLHSFFSCLHHKMHLADQTVIFSSYPSASCWIFLLLLHGLLCLF